MTGMLAWFAKNSVASNLLMGLILFGGLLTAFTIRKVVFPEVSSDLITVTVPYLGAAPEEVEKGVCTRIEEQVQDLETVKKVTSTAVEGRCAVTIELLTGADVRDALDDVKNRVDAISTFPTETERPVYSLATRQREVISVAVSGNLTERALREYGELSRLA